MISDRTKHLRIFEQHHRFVAPDEEVFCLHNLSKNCCYLFVDFGCGLYTTQSTVNNNDNHVCMCKRVNLSVWNMPGLLFFCTTTYPLMAKPSSRRTPEDEANRNTYFTQCMFDRYCDMYLPDLTMSPHNPLHYAPADFVVASAQNKGHVNTSGDIFEFLSKSFQVPEGHI